MLNGLTDNELLKRYLRDGAQDAFATLVKRHLAMVYGVALRRLHDPTPAQEVTQNVFITLARQAVWLTGHVSLGGCSTAPPTTSPNTNGAPINAGESAKRSLSNSALV